MTRISEKPMSNMLESALPCAHGRARGRVRARRRRHTLVEGSLRTSPSSVRPVTCEGGSAGGGVSASELFMPSLKPFTAPPRSWPMLRSFFVPKISTTTSNTIIQCQMLRLPIALSSLSCLRRPRQHRTERVGTAEHVHVHVLHVLMPDAAGVDDRSKTVARALLAREPPGKGQDLPQRGRIRGRRVVERRDVL